MARRIGKQKIMQGLINSVYDAAIQQQQAQLQAQMQTPAFDSGMTRSQIDSIYDSAIAGNQATPQTPAQTIPKLEDTSLPANQPTSNPTIASELERMQKLKAENKPRSESEQRAIDTYLADLQRASAPDYKPDYQAEIERMTALGNDTETNWSEGEINARNEYLSRLQDALAEEQRKNAIVTNPTVKKTSYRKKSTSEVVKDEPKKEQTNFTRTMSANEQRDFERAMKAVSKAKGRALSANEQRDMERALTAIANATPTTEEGSGSIPEQYADLSNGDVLQTLTKSTPTPSPMKAENLLNTTAQPTATPDRVVSRLEQGAKGITQPEVKKEQTRYDDRGFALGETQDMKIDRFVSPDTRMTKDEKKEAKEIVKDYFDNNPLAKRANTTNNANEAVSLINSMSDAERAEYQRMVTLQNKASGLTSYAQGILSSTPFLKTGGDKLSEAMGVDERYNVSNQLANAQTQNPLLYGAGDMTTKIAEYSTLSPYLENIPALTEFTNGLGTALAGGNTVLGGAIGSVLRGTMVDIPLDTVPRMIENAQNGMSAGDILTDAAGNIALNTAFNAGAEAIPYVWDAAKGLFNKQTADQAADIIRNADELNPAEIARQNEDISDAIARQRQAEQNVQDLADDLAKQTDNMQEEITEQAVKNNAEGRRFTEDDVNQMVRDIENGGSGGDIVPPDSGDVNTPRGKVSRFATNSMKHGTNLTPEEYARNVDLANFTYESKSERQSMEDAWHMIEDEGIDSIKARLLSDDATDLTQSEIDALMSITRTNNATARAMEAAGEDSSAIRAETNEIYKKLRQQSTSNAQALQALAKWTRNTPEGMLMRSENIISGNLDMKNSPLQEELRRLSRRRNDINFSPDFERRFMEEAERLLEIGDMDSREAKDIMARLGRMVNEQIPVRLNEKVQAYLMDNMLGNFRTLITRNAGGNLGLNLMEQTMTRPLAAGIDSLVARRTGRRTQAGLSGQGLAEYIQGFTKGIADEAHDLRTGLHTARTGENTLENAIRSNRHVFHNRVQDSLDSLVKNGLSVGDRPFYEATYKQTLGDYHRLRERGLMGEEIQNLPDELFEEYARTAANLNALAAVYQNDSMLSNSLMGFKRAIGQLSEGTLGFDILSQFSMPFVKTPANVIDRAIDYSPLGAIRNTARTIREGGIGGANFDQNRFVNETARNIIGTGLMAGGATAAANGLMSGAYDEDPDKKKQQKESGMQEFALNLPGNKQMDISWIPVLGSNAVAADAFYDAIAKSDKGPGLALAEGLKAGGQALFDQSMFQGLQRLFGTGETYNSDDSIVGNMMNVVKQGTSQAIPSLVRQIAQVSDQYQRDLGTSNKDMSFGMFDNYDINSFVNNIPGLREAMLNPKVDAYGNLIEESQGRSVGSKILEDMFLPGKITEVSSTRLGDEANRLFEATGNVTSYIPKPSRTKVDTEDHTLTNEEWLAFQQRYGDEITKAGEQMLDSREYQSADDATKEKMLSELYSAVSTSLSAEYNGRDISGATKKYTDDGLYPTLDYIFARNNPYGIEPKAYQEMIDNGEDMTPYEGYGEALSQYDVGDKAAYREAYTSGGAEALDKEVQYQTALKDMGLSDSQTNREAFGSDNIEGLQKIADYNKAFADAGMDSVYTSKSAQQAYNSNDLDRYAEYRQFLKDNDKDDSEKNWAAFKNGTLQKTTNAVPYLEEKYGLTKENPKKAYEKAAGIGTTATIPGITIDDFGKMYRNIDTDHNQGIKQTEIADYCNKQKLSQEEAQQIWKTFDTGWSKKLVWNGKKYVIK